MEKEVLIQFCDLREEAKDLERRIERLKKSIENMDKEADVVKGTRPDGTYGPIKVEGFPMKRYEQKNAALKRQLTLLQAKQDELLELTAQAEEYIESIEDPEMRIMFRLYYIDDLTWNQTAHKMNRMFPRRRYTADGCRMKNNRFFEKI